MLHDFSAQAPAENLKYNMKQLELFIEYRCNHRCIFCSAGNIMSRDVHLTLRQAVDILGHYRKQGYDFVNFTGGEPLLFEGIHLLLDYAKSIGFGTYISTNGSRLIELDDKYGLIKNCNQICLSLHGARPETQQLITGSAGSFELVHKALARIEEGEYNPSLIINTVVCEANRNEIIDLYDGLKGIGKISQLLVSNVAPEGLAAIDYRDKTLRLEEIGELVSEISQRYADRFLIRYFGIPLCVLGKYKALSNDLAYDPRLTVELVRDGDGVSVSEIRMDSPVYLREKPEVCNDCFYKSICGGVFDRYLRVFGTGELKPVKKGRRLK